MAWERSADWAGSNTQEGLAGMGGAYGARALRSAESGAVEIAWNQDFAAFVEKTLRRV